MAGIRRLPGAVVLAVIVAVIVAVALIGLTAAPGWTSDGSGRGAGADGSVLRLSEAQRAVVPVKRELSESFAIVLAAVLATAAGIGAASGTRFQLRRASSATPRRRLPAARLRGPPPFQLVRVGR